jgi:hypothetical protein
MTSAKTDPNNHSHDPQTSEESISSAIEQAKTSDQSELNPQETNSSDI